MTVLPWEQKCLRSLRIRPCQHTDTKPNPDLESVIDQQFVISNKNWFNFDIFSIPSITSITPVWAGREGRKGTRFSCWFVVNTELTLVITHQFQHLDQLIIITTHLVPQLMFLAPLQAVCLSLSADRIFLKSWNLLLLPTSHLPTPNKPAVLPQIWYLEIHPGGCLMVWSRYWLVGNPPYSHHVIDVR